MDADPQGLPGRHLFVPRPLLQDLPVHGRQLQDRQPRRPAQHVHEVVRCHQQSGCGCVHQADAVQPARQQKRLRGIHHDAAAGRRARSVPQGVEPLRGGSGGERQQQHHPGQAADRIRAEKEHRGGAQLLHAHQRGAAGELCPPVLPADGAGLHRAPAHLPRFLPHGKGGGVPLRPAPLRPARPFAGGLHLPGFHRGRERPLLHRRPLRARALPARLRQLHQGQDSGRLLRAEPHHDADHRHEPRAHG